MTRIIEAEKEYTRFHGQKAIDKFFKVHKELSYWREELEYMLESKTEFESDERMASGEYNNDWAYALHLIDDEDFTYICIIERA